VGTRLWLALFVFALALDVCLGFYNSFGQPANKQVWVGILSYFPDNVWFLWGPFIVSTAFYGVALHVIVSYRPVILRDEHFNDSTDFTFITRACEACDVLNSTIAEMRRSKKPLKQSDKQRYEANVMREIWTIIEEGGVTGGVIRSFLEAVCSLVVALTWSLVFLNASLARYGITLMEEMGRDSLSRHLYFIIVEFLTIGFGDIVPSKSSLVGGTIAEGFVIVIAISAILSLYIGLANILTRTHAIKGYIREGVSRYIALHGG